MMAADIVVEGLGKRFRTARRAVEALRGVSLAIGAGEFFVVLGPSGCGKSTLLNIIAGLEAPSAGTVRFGEKVVASASPRLTLTPKERNVAMVFQSYALYPHMDVFGNVAFPLKIARVPGAETRQRVERVAGLLGIETLLGARPRELSGGQRQRVAIARALVREPAVFLLDEPLSNLDAQLRLRMRAELKALQRRLGITTVYVTHDQVEAMTLGDRLAILKDGVVQQVGRPAEVYERPENTFVATFIGTPPMNLLPARLEEDAGRFFVVVAGERITAPGGYEGEVLVGVRPEDVEMRAGGGPGLVRAQVRLVENLGAEKVAHLDVGETRVMVRLGQSVAVEVGDECGLRLPADRLHFFDGRGRWLGPGHRGNT